MRREAEQSFKWCDFTISGVVAITAYSAFFAIMHNILADPRFKGRAHKEFGDVFDSGQRLAYTVLALIMMLPFIYIFVYLPDRILYIRTG